MSRLRKVSLALDPAVVDDLDVISKRLGISRSALVSQMLGEALPSLRQLFDSIPEAPTAPDLVRYKGESVEIIEARLASIKRLFADDDLLGGGD